MVVPLDREHLLAAVERSPEAFTVHDRDGWVRVFTGDARLEDPVGSQPHVGHEQIYRFYDTFIGPRDIKFHRHLDIVFATTVLRDLELEVSMAPAVTVYVPAFLRYDLREANGEWKVAELRAYWDLPAMMLQFLRAGSPAVSPALKLSRGLLANQGLRGTAGFMAGFRRVGERHKNAVETFVGALARRDTVAATDALSSVAAITLGDTVPLDITELAEQLEGARCTKMNGAGSTVTSSLSAARGRGIMFADMAWRGHTINRIRYFPA
jgi:hypothetical protein